VDTRHSHEKGCIAQEPRCARGEKDSRKQAKESRTFQESDYTKKSESRGNLEGIEEEIKMKAMCDTCKQEYEEKDPTQHIFIEADCKMICYDCVSKWNQEINQHELIVRPPNKEDPRYQLAKKLLNE
jgi:hypothetical protein